MKNNIINNGMSVKGENRRFFSLKGQMFLVGAILIVIALMLMRNLLGVFTTAQEEESVESIVADAQLRNIAGEYNYILGISLYQSAPNITAIDNLYNFSSFLRDDKDTKILYVVAYVNGTNQRYTVTLGNFLDDRINATVNVTGSNVPGNYFGDVNDKTNVTAEFLPNANGTITITLNYTTQADNITETLQANISTKNHFSLFYDITLEQSDVILRKKDVYNTTW